MNIAYDLLLLLFNLTQLHDKKNIIQLFTEGMSETFKPAEFSFSKEIKKQNGHEFEIKTRNSFLGFIALKNAETLPNEHKTLIHNAVQMLAVILERLEFDENLRKEKIALEEIAEKRNSELKNTNEELQKARKASLNLIEDLTEEIEKRTRSENKLKVSEERFRLVMENSLDAILITNPDGPILSANRSACKMFQMTEEEIRKAGRNGLVNINDPNLSKLMKERKKKGYTAGELTFFRKDGTLFHGDITTSVFRNSQGELRTSMIIRDITEKKQDEVILRESEERFSIAFKASPAPLVISEIETGLFIDVNDRWIKMLGYSKEELIGRTSKEVGIWHNPSERDRIIQLIHKNGFFKNEYIEFNTKSEETILALWSAETIRHSGKELMLSMIHDITKRVKAENELRNLKNDLEVEVQQKTRELRDRVAELERFQNATIEREFRIKELRDEVEILKGTKS